MRSIEKKAARLVNTGAVKVDYHRFDKNGGLAYAQGTVTSDHGSYLVSVEPDRHSCDCQFGINQPGRIHSHTRALELAVWKQARRDT